VEHEVVVAAPEWDGHVRDALRQSARFHDYGKVDVRFQTWLRGGDRMAARFAPKPIAKAGNDVLLQRKRAGLPEGFSHELLSVMFAEKSPETRGPTRDLILHLIAAHHGNCRPFPPVTLDEAPEDVSYGGLSICKRERMESAPCRLDSGTADRFWRLTAKYGWWGLAYLEALLRLADWQASSKEVAEVQD
jgi:CRISPR-associated endonuclease/helicase Cas3